jgi:acetylornithine deacetylase/succinyl-diaminopimelate desuccinylase-like protein
MSSGTTDSRHLRNLGIAAYGVSPGMGSRAEAAAGHAAHGPDERKSVKWLEPGAEYFRDVVRTLAL